MGLENEDGEKSGGEIAKEELSAQRCEHNGGNNASATRR